MVIDAHATTTKLTRSIRVAMSRALRARKIQPGIKKVRGHPAHSEACPEPSRRDGLQLADMLAGAVVESKVKGGIDHLAGLEDRVRVIWFEESEAGK